MYIKTNIEKKKYFCSDFDHNLKEMFLTQKIEQAVSKEQTGVAKSTSSWSCPNSGVLVNVDGFKKIYPDLLTPFFSLFGELLSGEKNKKFYLTRVWANEMFEGCSGKIHNHTDTDAVAIFYYKAPKNSSHFVIVDPVDEKKDDVEQYDMSEKTYIKINEGDLLIHSGKIFHGVSEHKSRDSRICFVFNLKFV